MFKPKRKKKLRREDVDQVMAEIREEKRRREEEAQAPAAPVNKQEIHIHNHPAETSRTPENTADADLRRLLERSRWLP